MTTPQEYRLLSVRYSRLAETARDRYACHQLQTLADSYMTLANSSWVLERSAKILTILEQQRKK